MSTAAQPQLEPGRAYRTRDLRRWSANPTRLARRLVDEGKLREAAHGLYYAPIPTRFGPAPASSEELLVPVFSGVEVFYAEPTLGEIGDRARALLGRLHAGTKRLMNPHEYPVGLEPGLFHLKTDLILKKRGVRVSED